MTFLFDFFFEKVKNYVQVCSEKGLKWFVHTINYEERVKVWEKKPLLLSLKIKTFTVCLPDEFWQSGQNCIQLVQTKVFPPFLLKNQIVTKKGLWEPEVLGRIVRTAFHVSRVTFREKQFLLKQKKVFSLSFPSFCWKVSKFPIPFGHWAKRFQDCWWNCTPLVQTKVLLGKRFAGLSMFIKLLAVGLRKLDILRRKFSVRLSQLHPIF